MRTDPRLPAAHTTELPRFAPTTTVYDTGVSSTVPMPPTATRGGRSDAALEAAARQALHREPLLGDCDVRLTVRDGLITLDGVVATYYQRGAAGRAVRFVEGCVNVLNRLEVDDIPRHGSGAVGSPPFTSEPA